MSNEEGSGPVASAPPGVLREAALAKPKTKEELERDEEEKARFKKKIYIRSVGKFTQTEANMIIINESHGFCNALKKYLLKSIDAENADSKGLKTLAMCWAFMKRAFSVSGSFRRMLSELIAELRGMKGPRQVNLMSGPYLWLGLAVGPTVPSQPVSVHKPARSTQCHR